MSQLRNKVGDLFSIGFNTPTPASSFPHASGGNPKFGCPLSLDRVRRSLTTGMTNTSQLAAGMLNFFVGRRSKFNTKHFLSGVSRNFTRLSSV